MRSIFFDRRGKSGGRRLRFTRDVVSGKLSINQRSTAVLQPIPVRKELPDKHPARRPGSEPDER